MKVKLRTGGLALLSLLTIGSALAAEAVAVRSWTRCGLRTRASKV